MTVVPDGKEIAAALRGTIVARLRALGFKGAYPHFHRAHEDGHVDLAAIQLAGGGGGFTVEIAYCDPGGKNLMHGYGPPAPKEIRVAATCERLRLGEGTDHSDPGRGGSDFWFLTDPSIRRMGRAGTLDELAALAARLVDEQGEPWWRDRRASHAN